MGYKLNPFTGDFDKVVEHHSASDVQFNVFNDTDPTKVIDTDASAITTGNTRTITMADADVDLAGVLTPTNKTDLTDGGETTLHTHPAGGSVVHNDTTSKQGGTTDEYYHLTVAEVAEIAANTSKVSADGSIDTHSDVDNTGVAKNDVLMWNGTNFVPVAEGSTFTFSTTSFSDGQSTTKLIGTGTWQAAEAIDFTAVYVNGPPTTADIQKSINGAAYATINTMDGPAYTTGNNTSTVAYPSARDQYLRFRLESDDGTDFYTTYDSAIYFRNYIRWGESTTGSSFSEANVEALSGSTISNDQTRSVSITAGASEYLVFAYPSAYTSLNDNGFIFNSVTCPFQAAETVSITNSAGFTENYKVYASDNTNLGSSTLVTSTSSTIIDPLYYGVTTKTDTFLEADIEGLGTNEVTNDNTQTWDEVTAAGGEYLLFSFPTRLGIPTFFVGGFEGGFESPETVSVTNVNGYTEDYYVWRSTNSGLGATTVETQ